MAVKKIHQRLFFLLVLLLPVQLGRHFWPRFSYIYGLRIDYLSPTVYLTDILVWAILGLWTLDKFKNQKSKCKMTTKNLKYFLLLFFLIVNCLLAKNQGAAFYKSLKIIEFFLLAFYISRQKTSLSFIIYPLSAAVIWSSLIALAQFFKQSSLGGIFWWLGERTFNLNTPGVAQGSWQGKLFLRPYATFSHPNSLAGFLLVSSILVLPFIKKRGKVFFGLLFMVFLTLLMTASLTVWLTVLILGLIYLVFFLGKKPAFIFFTLPIFFFLALLVFQTKLEKDFFFLRSRLNEVAIQLIKQSPILGIGLNNFIPALSRQERTFTGVYFLQPVHNIFLLIASETGLVGLFLFLVLIIKAFKSSVSLTFSLTFSLLAILLTGMADHYWLTLPQNQLLLTIVLGLIFSKNEKSKNFY